MQDQTRTSFDVFNAIQVGVQTLKDHTVPVLVANAILAAAAGAGLTVLWYIVAGDDYVLDTLIMVQQNQLGRLLFGALMGVVLLALIVALGQLFVARAYMQIRGSTSRGTGLRLGSNEPPLFQMAVEEVMVAKAAFLRFWRLWPILVTLALFPFSVELASEIRLLQLQGRDVPFGLVLLLWMMRLAMLGFLVWTLYKVIRLYVYLVPVAVEDGHTDLPAIKALAPSKPLLTAILSAPFWKHLIVVFLACLPAYLLGVLFDGFLGLFDAERRGVFLNFLFFTLRNGAYLTGAVFFVGALTVMLDSRRPPVTPPQTGADPVA